MNLNLCLEPHVGTWWGPLPSDSSIRDSQQRRAGYVADSVEQVLLLPRDMAKLRNLKKHEVFISLKRDLALVSSLDPEPLSLRFFYPFFLNLLQEIHDNSFYFLQIGRSGTHVVEKWVDHALPKSKDEESR